MIALANARDGANWRSRLVFVVLLCASCGRVGFGSVAEPFGADGATTRDDSGVAPIDTAVTNVDAATSQARCDDTIHNGSEMGIDCGGTCTPCVPARVYWSDRTMSVIAAQDLDGSNGGTIATGVSNPYMIDTDASYVYWVNTTTDVIARIRFDGSNQQILITQLEEPRAVVAHEPTGTMFYSEEGAGTISRASIDGTGIEVVASGLSRPFGVAIDYGLQKVYWIARGTSVIQRANFDGSELETITPAGIMDPISIALDPSNNHMYWSQRAGGALVGIHRANMDGSSAQLIVSQSGTTTQVALDLAAQKVYWVRNGSIRRANLDGSNVEDYLTSLTGGRGLALH